MRGKGAVGILHRIWNGFDIVDSATVVSRPEQRRFDAPKRSPAVKLNWSMWRPLTMGVYPPMPPNESEGFAPAVLVTRFTEPPMPSPSILACSVLLTWTDSTSSAGTVSSFTWRTPPSGDGMLIPLIVVLVSSGAVPRTSISLPSSRSRETPGRRPAASAMVALWEGW
jgi:hypothetical protein